MFPELQCKYILLFDSFDISASISDLFFVYLLIVPLYQIPHNMYDY